VLVPRLPEFSRLHPGIDLRIDASDVVRDLEGEGYDVALRYFRHDRAPRGLTLLHDEQLVPVLSPLLAARIGPIRRAADLGRATLLVEDAPITLDGGHWGRWFARARTPMHADAPLGRPMPSGWGYYLVVNRESARQRHVDQAESQ
jgi:DNA-binding transcriptional LysR family regulator